MKITVYLFLLMNLTLSAQIPEGKKVISSLYIYDMASGKSTLVLQEERLFEAPNWSPDGQYLLINSGGLLEKVSLEGEKLGLLNTDFVQQANNDHGFSFDGETLFISSGKKEDKGWSSYIFKVSFSGGVPVQITPASPSYWHGVSPNGKKIVYCAPRNEENYDVFQMDVNGGEEIRLTTTEGLDDGPEYTPGFYLWASCLAAGIDSTGGGLRVGVCRLEPARVRHCCSAIGGCGDVGSLPFR